MEENPYKATVELSEEVPKHRRARFGFLVLGTIFGAAVGGLLAAIMILIYEDEVLPFSNQFIPVACVASLACVGAVAGAIWEYCTRD